MVSTLFFYSKIWIKDSKILKLYCELETTQSPRRCLQLSDLNPAQWKTVPAKVWLPLTSQEKIRNVCLGLSFNYYCSSSTENKNGHYWHPAPRPAVKPKTTCETGTPGTFCLILTFPGYLCPGNAPFEGRADGHCSQCSQYAVCAVALMGTTVADWWIWGKVDSRL